jgi:hypothetical protein
MHLSRGFGIAGRVRGAGGSEVDALRREQQDFGKERGDEEIALAFADLAR